MSKATTQYEAADEQISKIIEVVRDPTQVNVKFRDDSSFYSYSITYNGRTFDHSIEELIKNHGFMIHPKSYHNDRVTVHNEYE